MVGNKEQLVSRIVMQLQRLSLIMIFLLFGLLILELVQGGIRILFSFMLWVICVCQVFVWHGLVLLDVLILPISYLFLFTFLRRNGAHDKRDQSQDVLGVLK